MKPYEMRILLDSYIEAKKRLIVAKMNFDEELELLTQIQLDYSKIKVQTSTEFDRIGNRIEQLSELRKIYLREADEAIKTMETVKGLISAIPDQTERDVLTRHYIKCRPWSQVASELNYSLRSVYYIRDKAVLRLCKERNKKWLD